MHETGGFVGTRAGGILGGRVVDYTPDQVAAMRLMLDAERGKQSLVRFIKMAWPNVEPNDLVWNWHIEAMAEHLEAVSKGEIRRLLICVPPGCMKSLTVATFWPAWDWITRPTRRWIFATYAQELSDKNAKLHRDLVMSGWFQNRWPEVNISHRDSRKIRLFDNTSKGFRFSTSVDGQVTGRHADILVFDDLVRSQDAQGRAAIDGKAIKKANEFWFETMVTRRADPSSTAMVGIMQRLHHEDAAGRCIESGDYECLVLPMQYDSRRKCTIETTGWQDPREQDGELLWPARFDQQTVDEIRSSLGSLSASAQLDQNPSPISGAIFNLEWLDKRWKEVPEGGRKIITVDCTFKDADSSDYVVVQCWAVVNNQYYLVDQLRGKWGVKKTCEKVLQMRARHRTAVGIYIEDKANGPAVIQILSDDIPGLVPWNPGRASKVERAESVSPMFEAGNVFLPPDDHAPWVGDYISEMIKFPVAKNDDQVDCTTMALLILHKRDHRKMKRFLKAMKGFRL